MKLTPEEAFDLLRKWRDERRLVRIVVIAAPAIEIAMGHGRIDQVSERSIQVSMESLLSAERSMCAFTANVPLADAEYQYSEDRVNYNVNAILESTLNIQLPKMGLAFGILVLNESIQPNE